MDAISHKELIYDFAQNYELLWVTVIAVKNIGKRPV